MPKEIILERMTWGQRSGKRLKRDTIRQSSPAGQQSSTASTCPFLSMLNTVSAWPWKSPEGWGKHS